MSDFTIRRKPDRVIVSTGNQQVVFRIDATGSAAATQIGFLLQEIERLRPMTKRCAFHPHCACEHCLAREE